MRFLLAGLDLMASAPAVAQEAETPADTAVYTNPDWLERPDPEDVIAAIPARALSEGVGGRVQLVCTVSTDGALHDCAVGSEDPPGYGFGAAGLMLSRQFLFRPATRDGVPIEASVTIPLNFDLAGARGFSRGASSEVAYVTSAMWLAAPTRAQVDAAFPSRANGAEGRAVVDCRVLPDGQLNRCRTISEAPDGRGFGRAARELTDLFQLAPFERPEGEVRVQIPVHFDLPGTPAGDGESSVMPNPEWRSLPDAPTVIAAFPQAARDAGVTEGRVAVTCNVQPTGAMSDCRAGTAEPAGLGFEEAAVSLARLFALNPWSADGRPVQTPRVRIPFRFEDAPPDAPAAD